MFYFDVLIAFFHLFLEGFNRFVLQLIGSHRELWCVEHDFKNRIILINF